MADLGNVIEALGCIAGQKRSCEGCPYFTAVMHGLGGFSYGYCAKSNVVKDAIALLKEQEPVKPSKALDGNGNWWRDCGKCGGILPKYAQYCPTCGRKVLVDG